MNNSLVKYCLGAGRNGRLVRTNILRWKTWEADFQKCVEKATKLPEEPDIATKLRLYGLYKQATVGDVEGKRPFMLSPSQAKYDAWSEYKGKSKDEAKKMYIDLINSLSTSETKIPPGTAPNGLKPVPGLDITVDDRILWITLNRPNKYNALTLEMYKGITDALNHANQIGTTVTVLKGSGQYFCSGNDLSNFANVKSPEDISRIASDAAPILNAYVSAYINHKKALIALINGPAIGIAVTVLPLFDLIIASDKATFSTPFTSLGISAEGCSSYTFPMLMGYSKRKLFDRPLPLHSNITHLGRLPQNRPILIKIKTASEILIFEKKLSAQEAFERNLVTRIVPSLNFREETEAFIRKISKLPSASLICNKAIIRGIHREALLAQCERETALLIERWQSEECMNAFKQFLIRKSDLM